MSTIYYDSSGHRYHKSHNNQSNGYVREGDSSGHVYSDPTHWTSKSSSSSHHSGSSSSSSSNNNGNVKTINARNTSRTYTDDGKVIIKDNKTGNILYQGSSSNVKEIPGKIIIGSNVNPGGWKDSAVKTKPKLNIKNNNSNTKTQTYNIEPLAYNNKNIKMIDVNTTTREYTDGKVVIKDNKTGNILYKGNASDIKEVPGKIIVGKNINPYKSMDEHTDKNGNRYHWENGDIIIDSGQFKDYILHIPKDELKKDDDFAISKGKDGNPEIDIYRLVTVTEEDDLPKNMIKQDINHPSVTTPKQNVFTPSLSDDITPTINTKINYFKDTGKVNDKGEEIWKIDYVHPDITQKVDTSWNKNAGLETKRKRDEEREKRLEEYSKKPGRKAILQAENTIVEGGEEIGETIAGHPGKIVGGAIGYTVAGMGEITTGFAQAYVSDRLDLNENIRTGWKSNKKVGDDIFNYLDTQVYSMEQIAGRPVEIMMGDKIKDEDLEMTGAFLLPGGITKGARFAKTGRIDTVTPKLHKNGEFSLTHHNLDVGLKNGYIALETTEKDKYSRKQLNWGNEKKATGERWVKEKYEIIPNGEKYVRKSNIEMFEYETTDTQRNKYIEVELEKQTKNRLIPEIDKNTKIEFFDSGKRGTKEKKVRNINNKNKEIVEYNELNIDIDIMSHRERTYSLKNPYMYNTIEKKTTFDLKTKTGKKSEIAINHNEGWMYNYEKTPEYESMNLDILDKKVKSYGPSQEAYEKDLNNFITENKNKIVNKYSIIPNAEKYVDEKINLDFVFGKPQTQRKTYKSIDDMNIPEVREKSTILLTNNFEPVYNKNRGPKGINWRIENGEFSDWNLEVISERVLQMEEEEKPEKIPVFPFERTNPGWKMKPWNILDDEEAKPPKKTKNVINEISKNEDSKSVDTKETMKGGTKSKTTTVPVTEEVTKTITLEKLNLDYIMDEKMKGINKDITDRKNRVRNRAKSNTALGYGVDNVLETKTKGKMKIEEKLEEKKKQTYDKLQKEKLKPDYDILHPEVEKLKPIVPDIPKLEPILDIPDIPPIIPRIPRRIRKKSKKRGNGSSMCVFDFAPKTKKGRKNEKNLNLLDMMF